MGLHDDDLEPTYAPPTYEGHPLFPRPDGSPEDRDIRFVTFVRRADGVIKHCPEDIPRDEIQDWAQVAAWWGGGDYQAVAKTDKHVVIRHYPSKSEWVRLDGPPQPFVKRGPRPVAPTVPAGVPEILGALANVVDGIANLLVSVERLQANALAAQGTADNTQFRLGVLTAEMAHSAFGAHTAPPPPVPAPPGEPAPAPRLRLVPEPVADVTMEDKAQIAGALDGLKRVPVESRIPVIQRLFPALGGEEARQWAEMIARTPLASIQNLVEQLAPAELRRIKLLNGFGSGG